MVTKFPQLLQGAGINPVKIEKMIWPVESQRQSLRYGGSTIWQRLENSACGITIRGRSQYFLGVRFRRNTDGKSLKSNGFTKPP